MTAKIIHSKNMYTLRKPAHNIYHDSFVISVKQSDWSLSSVKSNSVSTKSPILFFDNIDNAQEFIDTQSLSGYSPSRYSGQVEEFLDISDKLDSEGVYISTTSVSKKLLKDIGAYSPTASQVRAYLDQNLYKNYATEHEAIILEIIPGLPIMIVYCDPVNFNGAKISLRTFYTDEHAFLIDMENAVTTINTYIHTFDDVDCKLEDILAKTMTLDNWTIDRPEHAIILYTPLISAHDAREVNDMMQDNMNTKIQLSITLLNKTMNKSILMIRLPQFTSESRFSNQILPVITDIEKVVLQNTSGSAEQSWMMDNSGTLHIYNFNDMSWQDKFSIQHVIIEEGVTFIEDSAFESCQSLATVKFPTTLISIGRNAFSSCDKLSRIDFPSSLRVIESGAFSFCKNLQHVNFPESLQQIENDAFRFCDCLREIILPQSIIGIGLTAFSDISHLQVISLPKSLDIESEDYVETILYGCDNLNYIIYSGDNPKVIKSIEKFCKKQPNCEWLTD